MSRVLVHSTKTFPEKEAEQNVLNRSSLLLSESSKELKELFRSFDRVPFCTVTKMSDPTQVHHVIMLKMCCVTKTTTRAQICNGLLVCRCSCDAQNATNCALCGIVELQGPADSFRISDNILHKVIC